MTRKYLNPTIAAALLVALANTALLARASDQSKAPITAAERPDLIQAVTESTVLIDTSLTHGFLEDDAPDGDWQGSGFVIDRDQGWIMTNAHVAGFGVAEHKVQFVDQDDFVPATRLFVDTRHDIAVLKMDPDQIPDSATSVQIDCDYELVRGDPVFSIGHPNDQEFTASLGVMSGRKDFPRENDFFTTDLVVEPGSSGGPVVSLNSGKVLGMATAAYWSSDLGFMTKSVDLCRITERLAQEQSVARPLTGVQTQIRDRKRSNVIGAVFNADTELAMGDRVIAVDGKPWDHREDGDLEDFLRGSGTRSVELVIDRGGEQQTVNLPITAGRSGHDQDWVFFSGITIVVGPQMDPHFGYNDRSMLPAVVASVSTDFDGVGDAILDAGNELLRVDGKRFETLDEIHAYLLLATENEREVELTTRSWKLLPERITHVMTHSMAVEELDRRFTD